MEKTYLLNDFTNVIKFVLNRSDLDFIDMYHSIGLKGEGYIMEKFELARSNFPSWWCNLDPATQTNVIEYVKDFYNK